jgi:hypothetical protein
MTFLHMTVVKALEKVLRDLLLPNKTMNFKKKLMTKI